MDEAFLYTALRTPRGRGKPGGALYEISAPRLSVQVIDAVLARSDIDPALIEDVLWGTATQVGEQGGCLARAAVLGSRLPTSVAGVSLNRFCASGLEAVILAARQVQAGGGAAYLAGGAEMMSRVPMGSDGVAMAADPRLAIRHGFVTQGIAADLIASLNGISREAADHFAAESQRRAARAQATGHFAQSLVSVRDDNGLVILDQDETIRPETTVQALATLSPAFAAEGEGRPGFDQVALNRFPALERISHIHTAGNSSALADGAAAVLVGNAAFGRNAGLAPRARFVAASVVGSDPTTMLTGPVPAITRLLARAGIALEEVDLFEINEAFASVVLYTQNALGLDPEKVNVNGGAIAMGHPLGATGAILIGQALDALEARGGRFGVISLCVAGGMGVAALIERM